MAEQANPLKELLGSARKRHRRLLEFQIREANQTWSESAHAAFFTARDAAGRAEAIPRDAFHKVYDVALSTAQATAELIVDVAFKAGADDHPIEAYVVPNLQHSVDAFMMSCFGHGSSVQSAVGMRRQLEGLAGNTAAKARRLRDRLVILRDEFERTRPTRYDRFVAWCKHNPVAVLAMIVAAILTPVLGWAGSTSTLIRAITGR